MKTGRSIFDVMNQGTKRREIRDENGNRAKENRGDARGATLPTQVAVKPGQNMRDAIAGMSVADRVKGWFARFAVRR